jgi:hypothetical protein
MGTRVFAVLAMGKYASNINGAVLFTGSDIFGNACAGCSICD